MQSALRWLRIVARAGIVVIAVVALAGPASHAVSTFRRPTQGGLSYRAEADLWSARFACIAREIAEQVPSGTDVWIDPSSQAIGGGVWYQRLTETAFPSHQVVASPDQAQYQLTVEATSDPAACKGVQLVVTAQP